MACRRLSLLLVIFYLCKRKAAEAGLSHDYSAWQSSERLAVALQGGDGDGTGMVVAMMKRTSLRMLVPRSWLWQGQGRGRGGARVWGRVRPPCPRGANRARASTRSRQTQVAASIAGMRAQLEQMPESDGSALGGIAAQGLGPHLAAGCPLQTQPPSTCDGFVQAMLRCSDLEASAVAAKRNQLQALAREREGGNNERQDPNLATAGMRLIYLAAASSILRTAICKTDYFDLRKNWVIISSSLTSDRNFLSPLPSKLTGYFALPALNSCYSTLETSLLVPALPLHVWDFDINESFLAEEVDQGTARDCCLSHGSYQSRRFTDPGGRFHAGGVKQSESYLCIPTEIAEGRNTSASPENWTTVFSAIYPGEIYPVDTTTPHEGFSYCAVHKGIWNRYSEQGTDAPDGVHPFRLIREDVSQANVTQCAPLPSREMKDELEESALIAEFIQLLVSIIEMHCSTVADEKENQCMQQVDDVSAKRKSVAALVQRRRVAQTQIVICLSQFSVIRLSQWSLVKVMIFALSPSNNVHPPKSKEREGLPAVLTSRRAAEIRAEAPKMSWTVKLKILTADWEYYKSATGTEKTWIEALVDV
ncbi:hypothetical protein B0H14DRAFT_2618501 [Mycena olivaceomarginata]|nr:hypothetical protein B0H14DRAFT_2618501 [Mycena olivaceomarginata]